MKDAIHAHLEGLKLALEADDTAATRASLRRLARSLAHAAEASGDEDLAEMAREICRVSDADLSSEIRDLVAHAESTAAPPHAPDLEVLVVEDDRVLATLLHTLLKRQARKVHVAASAEDAERLVQQHPIDVILLDLVLPDRDGRDFLMQLRESPDTARIPVVVLSAHDSAAARAECLAVGAADFLAKPPDPPTLRAAVARVAAPAARTASPAEAETRRKAAVSTPTRVLFVEDDRVTAMLIRHRLVRDGMEVTDFANGEDAFRWAEESEFDIAILDVKVPGMDGFELLGRLRAIPRLANLPVLMLTALAGEADVVRGLGLGASDYMVKPFSPAELLARVRRLVPTSIPPLFASRRRGGSPLIGDWAARLSSMAAADRAFTILALSVLALVVTSLGFAGLALLTRLANDRRERRHAGLVERWEPLMLDVLSGQTTDDALHQVVASEESGSFVAFLMGYARRLRGAERAVVRRLAAPYLPHLAATVGRGSGERRALAVHRLAELGLPEYTDVVAASLEELSFRRYPRFRDLFRLLGVAVLENVGYRQLSTYWRIRGMISKLGGAHTWGAMERRGFRPTPERA